MKKLINSVDSVLTEQLQGFALAYPQIKLIEDPLYITRAISADKVAIISGGGSGHEPMHGGFVGLGMLDGACPGQIFTSPTPDQMYECGQAVNKGKGVLLIIKNYTGDILNFETAIELLDGENISVGAIVIDDDVAVKDSLHTAGRRGVANTVLAEKILGAAAERGASLDVLEKLGHDINNAGHSIGIALGACTVPAAGKPSFILNDEEMEFGVGIHGEPGIKRCRFSNLDDTVEQMFHVLISHGDYSRTLRRWDRLHHEWIEEVQQKRALKAGDQVIALVNNLGATPVSELYGVYNQLAQQCDQFGIKIVRRLVGSYCTSLDMQGVSITLLNVNDDWLSLWDAPVNTPALRWGC